MPMAIVYDPDVDTYQIPGDPGFRAGKAPVCSLFREFCDCAACLVLDRQGACEPCPGL